MAARAPGVLVLAAGGIEPRSSDCFACWEHLFDESYVCALRADHPDATARALSIDRFCDLDHALVYYTGERFWGVTERVEKRRR